jgi:hypothetical protein
MPPSDRQAPGAAEEAFAIDSDRAIVECFFGRLKRRFTIPRDEGYGLSAQLLDDVVTICIAPTNQRHRARGYAPLRPLPGFVREVPQPLTASEVAARGIHVPAALPPRHAPDAHAAATTAFPRRGARIAGLARPVTV